MKFIFMQNMIGNLLSHVCKFDRSIERKTTTRFDFKVNMGFFLIKTNANCLKFSFQQYSEGFKVIGLRIYL